MTHQHCLEDKAKQMDALTENMVSAAGSETREERRRRIIQKLRRIQLSIEERRSTGSQASTCGARASAPASVGGLLLGISCAVASQCCSLICRSRCKRRSKQRLFDIVEIL